MTSIIPTAYDAAARVQRHTWLTVGGGAALVPLLVAAFIIGSGSEPSIGSGFILFLQVSAVLLAVGIVPALLFAFLREPVMRRLFTKTSQLIHPWGRAVMLLTGTLLIFLSYTAVAVCIISLYIWLETPSEYRTNYWQYLTTDSTIMLIIVRLSFVYGLPWLLAALASAWYVNRDLLPGNQLRN